MLGRILVPAALVLGVWVYLNSPQPKTAHAIVTQACSAASPGAVTVTLAWPAPGASAQEAWLDVGLADRFPDGSFRAYGPLAAAQTAYAIDGVPAGVTYHYRVNVRYDEGWRVSAAGTFVSKCSR